MAATAAHRPAAVAHLIVAVVTSLTIALTRQHARTLAKNPAKRHPVNFALPMLNTALI